MGKHCMLEWFVVRNAAVIDARAVYPMLFVSFAWPNGCVVVLGGTCTCM